MTGHSATRGAAGLRAIVVDMTLILILALFAALAVLAPLYGTDSRNLRDHPWESPRR